MANRIFQSVKEIGLLASDECQAFLRNQNENAEPVKLWGSHILCQLPNEQPADTSLLQDFTVDTLSNNNAIDQFSMQYSQPPTTSMTKSFNRAWLQKHVNADLIDTLVRMVQSKKSNTELQNELIELLGFDKFEIVQTIFDNRTKIVQTIEQEDKRAKLLTKTLTINEQRPSIASQVSVSVRTKMQNVISDV